MSEAPAPKAAPPARTGACGAYPKCPCPKVEKDFTIKGEWPYCVCGHTIGVHAVEVPA